MDQERETPGDHAALANLQRIGGSKLVQAMIASFSTHAPQMILLAREARQQGNWSEVERAGHNLKSSAAHLGLKQLQQIAQEVEATATTLIGQNGTVETAARLERLIEDLALAGQQAVTWLNQIGATDDVTDCSRGRQPG